MGNLGIAFGAAAATRGARRVDQPLLAAKWGRPPARCGMPDRLEDSLRFTADFPLRRFPIRIFPEPRNHRREGGDMPLDPRSVPLRVQDALPLADRQHIAVQRIGMTGCRADPAVSTPRPTNAVSWPEPLLHDRQHQGIHLRWVDVGRQSGRRLDL